MIRVPRAWAKTRRGKRESVTYSMDREEDVSKIFIVFLLCVWRVQERFLFRRNGFKFRTSIAKRVNLKPLSARKFKSFACSKSQQLAINKSRNYFSSKNNSKFSRVVLSSYYLSRRSVWENPGRGREYRPNAVRSVHTTKVTIPLYGPTKLGLKVIP